MIDTHKEIIFLVKERKWKQDKAEDVVNLFQRQAEKGYESLATKADLADLKGEIKTLNMKITMFMWFIAIVVALLECAPYIMKIVTKG
jgi:hypothetical protein